MYKTFFSPKILLFAALLAGIFTFFFIPFLVDEVTAGPASVNPCPNPQYCSLNSTYTLYNFLQNHQRFDSINWNLLVKSFITLFIFYYGEILGIIYIFKKQKKANEVVVLLKKVLVFAAMIVIPFYFLTMLMASFGFPFSWNFFIIAFLVVFIICYGEIQGFLYIIKKQKTKSKLDTFEEVAKRVVIFVVMNIIILFLLSTIFSFWGLSFFGLSIWNY